MSEPAAVHLYFPSHRGCGLEARVHECLNHSSSKHQGHVLQKTLSVSQGLQRAETITTVYQVHVCKHDPDT
jgi:hypothetical protein